MEDNKTTNQKNEQNFFQDGFKRKKIIQESTTDNSGNKYTVERPETDNEFQERKQKQNEKEHTRTIETPDGQKRKIFISDDILNRINKIKAEREKRDKELENIRKDESYDKTLNNMSEDLTNKMFGDSSKINFKNDSNLLNKRREIAEKIWGLKDKYDSKILDEILKGEYGEHALEFLKSEGMGGIDPKTLKPITDKESQSYLTYGHKGSAPEFNPELSGKQMVEKFEDVTIKDSNGNPILDENGNEKTEKQKITRLETDDEFQKRVNAYKHAGRERTGIFNFQDYLKNYEGGKDKFIEDFANYEIGDPGYDKLGIEATQSIEENAKQYQKYQKNKELGQKRIDDLISKVGDAKSIANYDVFNKYQIRPADFKVDANGNVFYKSDRQKSSFDVANKLNNLFKDMDVNLFADTSDIYGNISIKPSTEDTTTKDGKTIKAKTAASQIEKYEANKAKDVEGKNAFEIRDEENKQNNQNFLDYIKEFPKANISENFANAGLDINNLKATPNSNMLMYQIPLKERPQRYDIAKELGLGNDISPSLWNIAEEKAEQYSGYSPEKIAKALDFYIDANKDNFLQFSDEEKNAMKEEYKNLPKEEKKEITQNEYVNKALNQAAKDRQIRVADDFKKLVKYFADHQGDYTVSEKNKQENIDKLNSAINESIGNYADFEIRAGSYPGQYFIKYSDKKG